MENLLESNERTLVMFDAVCLGLAECLELVHTDVKQMTEHRNYLLAQQQVELERRHHHQQQQQQQQQVGASIEADVDYHPAKGEHHQHQHHQHSPKSSPDSQDKTLVQTTDLDSSVSPDQLAVEDDPHHLARLKLLDKRLADSFSQALSMCTDQQKSSQAKTREQRALATANATKTSQDHRARPGILQMLLGRGGTGNNNNNNNNKSRQHKKAENGGQAAAGGGGGGGGGVQPTDTRLIIDDINQQTRLAMQYSKRLEANLIKVEDLRAKYEMHLKMGLVVKSVSRAYLSNCYTAGGEPDSPPAAVGSLGRPQQRRAHHLSSLMVNDSSSLGATTTTTRSSLSSLNLSSWSFSRRQNSGRSSVVGANGTKQSRKQSRQNQQQPAGGLHETKMLEDQRHAQTCVSTISLDSMSNQQARHGVSKLISPTSGLNSIKKQHSAHSPMVGSQNTAHQEPAPNYQLQLLYQQQADQFTCGLTGADCDCRLMEPPVDYDDDDEDVKARYTPKSTFQTPVTPTRPLSQYIYGVGAEFATPTTTGTLAGQPKQFSYTAAGTAGSGAGAGAGFTAPAGLLHKSASHSSLKKLKGNSSSHRLSGLYPNAPHMSHNSGSAGSKNSIKEFIDNIERLEAEFETYMGSFLMNIEDIQGFARVCHGDVFEIIIRYGTAQKFKTKISVLKDNRQKCDHKRTVFNARIADVIAIKAYECKGLGKKVLLGHKLCETRDLFMARSQLMTISLNQTGSIKLNLIITWNPLHMTPNSPMAVT